MNHIDKTVEPIEWTDKTGLLGLHAPLDFDKERQPFVYALGKEAVVKVDMQTKEVSEVVKVTTSPNSINAFEMIPDGKFLSMFTYEYHQGRKYVTKRALETGS